MKHSSHGSHPIACFVNAIRIFEKNQSDISELAQSESLPVAAGLSTHPLTLYPMLYFELLVLPISETKTCYKYIYSKLVLLKNWTGLINCLY